MLTLVLASLLFTLPTSLEPYRSEITQVVEMRKQEFLEKCYRYQKPKKCDRVAERARVEIVDDFVFPTKYAATGLASGLYAGLRNIKVSLYNRFGTNDPALCTNSPIIRTREQMYEFSDFNNHWLTYPFEYVCANPNDLLPALVHELCHAFGRNVGHIEGFNDCQERGV